MAQQKPFLETCLDYGRALEALARARDSASTKGQSPEAALAAFPRIQEGHPILQETGTNHRALVYAYAVLGSVVDRDWKPEDLKSMALVQCESTMRCLIRSERCPNP